MVIVSRLPAGRHVKQSPLKGLPSVARELSRSAISDNMLLKKRKNIIIAAISVFYCCSMFSEEPKGYYGSAKGKTGDELRVSLHNIIKDHSVPDYSELWNYFKKTDATPEGKPWCMYSGHNFTNKSGIYFTWKMVSC